MDHNYVIEAGKAALLGVNTLPKTRYFFVEYDGALIFAVIPPCSCGRTEHHCFDVARQAATLNQWDPQKIEEVAYVGIESQADRDQLVIAFEKVGAAPTFTVHTIEVRQVGGRTVLLDSDEVTTDRHHLLYIFGAGACSAPLSDSDLTLLKAMFGVREG